MTFLFISHHLQEIYEICERVAVMRDGRLVAEAAVDDLDHGELVAAMVGESYVSTQGDGGRQREQPGRQHFGQLGFSSDRARCRLRVGRRSGARRLDAGSRG